MKFSKYLEQLEAVSFLRITTMLYAVSPLEENLLNDQE